MSTLTSLIENGNLPFFIVSLGLVVAGIAMIATAVAASLRVREISEE